MKRNKGFTMKLPNYLTFNKFGITYIPKNCTCTGVTGYYKQFKGFFFWYKYPVKRLYG